MSSFSTLFELFLKAVTRQQALRYASSLPTVGHLAEAITARTSRPDLDGLTAWCPGFLRFLM